MKDRLNLTALVALAGLTAGAPIASGQSPTAKGDSAYTFYDSLYADELPADSSVILTPARVGFGVGEKLVFSVQYGLITAGEATLEVRNLATIRERPCYRIVSDARTNDFFSKFYQVRDRYESYMDTTELYSLHYEKHIREGKFKRDEVVEFDQSGHRAIYKDKVVPIPPMAHDVLSALYFVRTLPLEVGQSVAIANHIDGKNYPLIVKVHGRERVKVDAGEFDCLVVEPILRGPGVFTQKGRLTVWLTDDEIRMPVLMKSKVVIGHVAAILKSYETAPGKGRR
ncbi:MAG TPA: DUF3108 domain-containing protein [Candidatus Krumholzibacteria bacterium]|nr:DUF3108 domain-containing protein [Candidatus Krumholzibacteria bacterium]